MPFEAGELVARAYDADGHLIAEDIQRTPGESHHIVLSAEDAFLLGDGEDMTFVTITVADESGNPVENAVDRVLVDVDGCGRLLGLDNGDSTDRDGYKTNTRACSAASCWRLSARWQAKAPSASACRAWGWSALN